MIKKEKVYSNKLIPLKKSSQMMKIKEIKKKMKIKKKDNSKFRFYKVK